MLRRIFHLKIWTKTGENSVFSRLLNFCPIITHSSMRLTIPVAFMLSNLSCYKTLEVLSALRNCLYWKIKGNLSLLRRQDARRTGACSSPPDSRSGGQWRPPWWKSRNGWCRWHSGTKYPSPAWPISVMTRLRISPLSAWSLSA